MIEFPETAASEWKIIADAENKSTELRRWMSVETKIETAVENEHIRYEARLRHQQLLDADTTPALVMMSLDDYKADPSAEPVDLIEGVFKGNGLMVVLGPSGVGKSTLASQMLICLLTGNDFLGQTTKPLSGSVGFVSYDQDPRISLNWMSKVPNMDPRRMLAVDASNGGNPLNVPDMRKQLAKQWQALNTEVVLIDSFSASFFGQDQNDAAATMRHYRDLKRFALHEVGAKGVIVITHSSPGSPNKARGSTVHHDVADSIIAVVPDPKTKQRTIEMVKYRAALGQSEMPSVIVTKPDSVTHLVDLDGAAMSLAGMSLPPSIQATAFTEVPETMEDPETDSETTEEDDDL